MQKRQVKKWITTVCALAVCGVAAGQVPADIWANIAHRAALFSVGLQKPEGSAMVISEKLQVAAAGKRPTTVLPTFTTPTTTAPTAATTRPAVQTSAPAKDANAGVALEQLISTGDKVAGAVAVRNKSGKVFNFTSELQKKPTFKIQTDTDNPQVLIVHTHTTEGYLTYDTGYFNPADIARTHDTAKNVCAAGAAIAETLRAAGVATVQDLTVHDSPKYTGAYSRSEQTVKAALKKYPSVKVVLDIHRDAIIKNDTTHTKPTAVIDGKKAAQLMIIAGTVSTKELPHPDWQQNFRFSLQLQNALAGKYPDLMRPLYLVASRYNQHLAPGYLLVEVGSDVNTVDEAVYSGKLLGKTLAEVLKSL